MAAATRATGLSALDFADPHRDPAWRGGRVAAGGASELPGSPGSAGSAGAAGGLRVEVAGAGRTWDLEEWAAGTWTTGLLVVADGAVLHEWYAEGLGPDTLFLGASMTKSVLAHLVGLAVREGALAPEDPVTRHVPELRGSGYDGVSVLDLLTMTSGVDWVEDHRDPDGPASRLVACFTAGGDSRRLLESVRPGAAPGTRFAYCTADSQVLDWVRERATGRAFLDEAALLWRALGCTRDAVVACDAEGVALAGGGLAASVRDWARVALLAVDGTTRALPGVPDRALLDPDWVARAARPAYPFTSPGRLPSSITTHAGFGLHWWPLDADGARVTADGSRGQLACADRRTGAAVVKTSLWPYDDFLVDRQARDLSYLGLHALLDATTQKEDPQ